MRSNRLGRRLGRRRRRLLSLFQTRARVEAFSSCFFKVHETNSILMMMRSRVFPNVSPVFRVSEKKGVLSLSLSLSFLSSD